MPRRGGRKPHQLREVSLTPNYLDFAEGSCLVTWGRTRVLCAATVLETVPSFRLHSGGGWITAEYSMLPRSTPGRQEREARRGQLGGRTQEISRLIGRSLRAAVNLAALGPRTVILDCDVLQADGGTRTAGITGAFAALALALEDLRRQGRLASLPLVEQVAAVSVGAVSGQLLLDLNYEEDSQAAVDANFVGTGRGELIEVQLSGEAGPFPAAHLQGMLALAQEGLRQLFSKQEEALRPWLPLSW